MYDVIIVQRTVYSLLELDEVCLFGINASSCSLEVDIYTHTHTMRDRAGWVENGIET